MKCRNCQDILHSQNSVDIDGFTDYCYSCYSKMKPKRLCIDFDGVMAQYNGWKGEKVCGPPMPDLTLFFNKLKALDPPWEIVIHTTRNEKVVWNWLKQHGYFGFISMVTNKKLPAHVYLDDRGIRFTGSFDEAYEQIITFKPYWKQEIK